MKKKTSPRGRPRDPDRMKRVLETGIAQFVEQGFVRVSMDAVAKASGVSKVTIYTYFPTKAALFEACVDHGTDKVFDSLPPGMLDPNHPEIALNSIGESFLKLVRADDVLGSFRLMFEVAGEHVDACEAFCRQGPEKLIRQVAGYLRAANDAGSLSIPAPDEAADQFLALFHGRAYTRAMLGLGKPTAEEDRRLLRANVSMFLKAFSKPA